MEKSEQRLKQRLEKLFTSSLCDASPLVRAFAPGLKAVRPELKMVGIARPVSCTNDYLTVIKAISEAKEGEVLVVDGHRQSQAVFGELLAAESKRRKLAGVVIDGAVRDVKGMQKIDIPVYYRWTCPRAGRADIIEPPCEFVSVCGVTVMAGDWVLGDADGIVTVSAEQVEDIVAVAEEIQKVDQKIFENIKKGASLVDITRFEEFRRQHEREIRTKLDFQLSK